MHDFSIINWSSFCSKLQFTHKQLNEVDNNKLFIYIYCWLVIFSICNAKQQVNESESTHGQAAASSTDRCVLQAACFSLASATPLISR